MSLMRPLTEMREQMERIFRDMEEFPLFSRQEWRPSARTEALPKTWLPPVDISEIDNSFLVKAEIPGIKAEDLNIEVTDNAVIIQGESKEEQTETRQNMYRQECRCGSVYRRITLPEPVKSDNIDAELKHGILTLKIPKQEERRGRHIPVRSSK